MEYLWTVAAYTDTLRKRPAATVRNEQKYAEKWKREMNVFTSEADAFQFMFSRAWADFYTAEKRLKDAKKRIKRLDSKFAKSQAEAVTKKG